MAVSGRRSCINMTMLCSVLVALAVGAGVTWARLVNEEGCPEVDYAYAFQSVCQDPALFGNEYHLVAPFSNALVAAGGLTPDSESLLYFTGNQTDEGASYVLTPVSSVGDTTNITLATAAFTVTNSDTNKTLGWVFMPWQRGLLLAELDSASSAAHFVLQTACNVPLPCPETIGARCESYFFLTGANLNTGFVATNYFNQGLSYVAPAPQATSGNLPLLLRRSSSSASNVRQVVGAAA